MGGRAQCWGQLTHGGATEVGACCTTFSRVGKSGNRNLFGLWTTPRSRYHLRGLLPGTHYSLSFYLLTRASSWVPNAQTQKQGYFILKQSQSPRLLWSVEGWASLLQNIPGWYPLQSLWSLKPSLHLGSSRPLFTLSLHHPPVSVCLFLVCLFCGSFFVFITFWWQKKSLLMCTKCMTQVQGSISTA